ncbi:MAG TPA: glycosyltransferase [Steroidobacteraceae bacterium]|nr:glycosyltransferase [Steroidobacteraceae bacterium]
MPRIAVLIPCYNEAAAITAVVRDFAAALPEAVIYVYDNNSKDETRARAAEAGAIVRTETFQGKGNVVRRMFADIEAEVYVLVDGDGTYDAPSARKMVDQLLENSLDMVNGARVAVAAAAFRPGHAFGNRLLTGTVAAIFGDRLTDMLSGYRVMSRRFVKSFPALATGFETETELTVHALELRLPVAEVSTPYRDRPVGSQSKLRTFHDGFRILKTIFYLVREERPLQFFSGVGVLFVVAALVLGAPLIPEFIRTGLVPRIPTAVLATGLVLLGAISFVTGLILDLVTLGRREMKRLHYLSLQGPTVRERRRTLTP